MDTPVTYAILGVTIAASLWGFSNQQHVRAWLMNPYQVVHHKEYKRLILHSVIHADWMHLIFNMYVFYIFGRPVEIAFTNRSAFTSGMGSFDFWGASMGTSIFLILYLGAILTATIPSILKHRDNPGYNSLGASGAVSAVLITFILMYPTTRLLLFFAIPMPAWAAGIFFFAYESYMNKRGGTGIAHDAHLWGALFALILLTIVQPSVWPHFISELPFIN